MQIRVEIEVTPEELRRFLGLPDVAGLQEDLMAYVRDRLGDVNENFRPSDFVRANLETVLKSKAWRRIMDGERAVEEEERAATKRPARKAGSGKRGGKGSSGGT